MILLSLSESDWKAMKMEGHRFERVSRPWFTTYFNLLTLNFLKLLDGHLSICRILVRLFPSLVCGAHQTRLFYFKVLYKH